MEKIYSTKSSTSAKLPIAKSKQAIIDSVRNHKTTVVVGETGSGKSTQLPQYLSQLLGNGKKLVCTQPRRVATISVAQRVAFERECAVGDEVGYSIRFEDKFSSKTKIKFVTDGVLLRECMGDKDLGQYDIIILDEAHERSLQTDILMGLLRDLQEKRPSLRIVVMSATLQIDLFMNFFLDTNLIKVPGRQYPVDVYYTFDAVHDYLDAALLTCMQIHANEEAGGVLVFLPGQDDIESLYSMLEDNLSLLTVQSQQLEDPLTTAGVVIDSEVITSIPSVTGETCASSEVAALTQAKTFVLHPLYAGMTPDDQLKAFKLPPRGVRKFVLATNIAETSVTIAGIKYVVDCGFVKSRMMMPTTGVEMLKVVSTSKAQANQRAGRSGRECPGKCFRLYTEETFEGLDTLSVPEIQRVNMAQVILQLKEVGVQSILDFHFLSPPSELSVRKALEILLLLGALDKTQSLTPHGRDMARLPLEPKYANLLLKASQFGCVAEVLTAVALLSTDNVFVHPHREADKQAANAAHRRFSSRDGDIPALVNVFEAWLQTKQDKSWATKNYLSQRSLLHASSIRQQLSNLIRSMGHNPAQSCQPERDPFLRCIACGLFLNVAQLVVNHDLMGSKKVSSSSSSIALLGSDSAPAPYKTMRGGQQVYVHPSSVLFAIANTKKLPEWVVYSELLVTTKQYMRGLTVIDGSWLPELVSHFHSKVGAPTHTLNRSNSAAGGRNTHFTNNKHALTNDADNFQVKSAAVVKVVSSGSNSIIKKRKLGHN